MRGRSGRTRAISRKTVRPPTPLSKIPMAVGCWPLAVLSLFGERPTANGELFGAFSGGDTRTTLSFDVVLLDFLIEIRSWGIDRLRGLVDIPAMLTQFRQDERLLCLVFAGLQRRQLHRAGDDLRRCPEELRRKIGDIDRIGRHHDD